ncbi:MAG: TetM/TetW/TetO/TetS family tetracycline resistance ribosomal protection protein [Hungatella hathewayi]|nr:TetM/TetW/TetO/TetS family tetracycline resistance ribosomal protection protein [Hungatella hathewayi]
MEDTSENKPIKHRKQVSVALLAHVDAGKTTLSEAMLYTGGNIRKLGRVDRGDAFLDTYELEKKRGITIFSKQAVCRFGDMEMTLLDTPGHVDFSAEMERTLQVLDYAILVISGLDGVQGHTRTLWRLLARYQVPVFLFVNKMDLAGERKATLLEELRSGLDGNCVDFSGMFGGEERVAGAGGGAGTVGTAGNAHALEDGLGGEPVWPEAFYEAAAMCREDALEEYLETGAVSDGLVRSMISGREMFPCFFGSALKLDGVEEFLEGMEWFMETPKYPEEFGARVFKISRDGQGNRLAYLKITGGSLKVKDMVDGEKVNQIRVYSGEKFETLPEAEAGTICAVTGLTRVVPGQGLGYETASVLPVLEPVLTYRLILPEEVDAAAMLPKLAQLEEEDPKLHITWEESKKEIHVQLMGEIQMEILKSLLKERFGVDVEFGERSIVYKETILNTVEGVGHFEPLRHYAEVHLLLEPGEAGSGLQFAADCREEVLEKNWQRLVLTHLEEKVHRGVLTGAAITDMKITLKSGRAHKKHTEGGDFRQAVYRAVRQGLMEAECELLEPYYEFRLEVPERMAGRAMTDLDRMYGKWEPPMIEDGTAVLTGTAPVACMDGYQKEVTAYTAGAGHLSCSLKGYGPCHNADEVIEAAGYDPEGDLDNPPSSVFCTHGAGFIVGWDEVKDYMHLDSCLAPGFDGEYGEMMDGASLAGSASGTGGAGSGGAAGVAGWGGAAGAAGRGGVAGAAHVAGGRNRQTGARASVPVAKQQEEIFLGTDEVDAILNRTFYANSRGKEIVGKEGWKSRERRSSAASSAPVVRTYTPSQRETSKEEYLLVDGYNIIFAWEELRELAELNIDSARGRLLDILCNYQAIRRCHLITVFDAYRVQGHVTECFDYHNIQVVYTKEAETADQYIEKFAHEHGRNYRVTVATSDRLEQIIIRGQGCLLISARELEEAILQASETLRDTFTEMNKTPGGKHYLLDSLSEETRKQMEEWDKSGE